MQLLHRLYRGGNLPSEDAVMAADAALSLPRVERALQIFVALLSKPEAQPEFRSLQVCCTRHAADCLLAVQLASCDLQDQLDHYVHTMLGRSRTTKRLCSSGLELAWSLKTFCKVP